MFLTHPLINSELSVSRNACRNLLNFTEKAVLVSLLDRLGLAECPLCGVTMHWSNIEGVPKNTTPSFVNDPENYVFQHISCTGDHPILS